MLIAKTRLCLKRAFTTCVLLACSVGASAAIECDFEITESWGSGGNAQIAVSNSGDEAVSVEAFTAQFDAGISVGSSWHTQLSGSNPYTFTPFNWNNALGAGQTNYYGFSLNGPLNNSGSAILGGFCEQVADDSNAPPVALFECEEVVAVPISPPGTTIVMETYATSCHNQSYDPDTWQPEPEIVSVDWGDGTVNTSLYHEYVEDGSYTVTLTVSDGLVSDSSSVTVDANGNTRPPMATASCSVNSDQSVSCDGSASVDPDGDSLQYLWDWNDGNYDMGVTASHQYPGPGTYTVSLSVTDGHNSDSDSVQVVIQESTELPAEFSWSANGLTVDVDVPYDVTAGIAHTWSWGDGSPDSVGFPQSHTYAQAGTYTVTLNLQDEAGNTGSASQEVTVEDPDPVGVFSGLSCELVYTGGGFLAELILTNHSDLDLLEPWQVELTFPEGTQIVNQANATVSGNNPYIVEPLWTAGIPAGESEANTPIFSMEGPMTQPEFGGMCDPAFTPVNAAPEASITDATVDGANVSVQADVFDADGDELEVFWRFGDGASASGSQASHRYTESGTYTITLQVSDGKDTVTASTEVTIVLDEPDEPALAQCTLTTNNFDSGFVYYVEVNNVSDSMLSDWQVCLLFDENSEITNSFNTQPPFEAQVIGPNWECFGPVSWNNNLQPGQAISFGFVGTGPGEILDVDGVCDTID